MKHSRHITALIAVLATLAFCMYRAGAVEEEVTPNTASPIDARRYDAEVHALQFTADSKSLLTIAQAEQSNWEAMTWGVPLGQSRRQTALPGDAGQPPSQESRRFEQRAAVSKDAQLLAVAEKSLATGQPRLTLYQANGKLLRQLDLERIPRAILFSPDGQLLATAESHAVRLWQVDTGKVLKNVWHDYSVTALAFSPDGKQLLSGTNRGVILCGPGCEQIPWGEVRFTATSEPYISKKLPDPVTPAFSRGVDALAYTPDGRYAVIANGFDVRFWDLQREAFGQVFSLPEDAKDPIHQLHTLAFSPDGKQLAVACSCQPSMGSPQQIHLWQIESNQLLVRLKGHRREIRQVAFSPDSQLLVSSDGQTKLWDTRQTRSPLQVKRRHTLQTHRYFLSTLAFSPDGKTLATGAKEGKVKFWDVASGQLTRELNCRKLAQQSIEVNAVAYSPDGKQFLFAGGAQRQFGEVHVLDWPSGKLLHRLRGHDEPIESIALSSQGRRLVSASYDKKAIVWDMTTGQPLRTIANLQTSVADIQVALSPDSRTLSTRFSPPQLWDVKSGKLLGAIGDPANEAGPDAIAFSPTDAQFASGNYDGSLSLWETNQRARLATQQLSLWNIEAVAYAPDGRWIAAGVSGSVVLLEASLPWVQGVHTELGVAQLGPHVDHLRAMAYSPDGRLLALGSQNGEVQLWEVTTR